MMIIKTTFLHRLLSQALLFFMVAISVFSLSAHAEDNTLDKIIAIVNDDVVMLSEVKRIALRVKKSGGTNLSDNDLMKEVLDKIILEKVQLHRAKDIGINVDDASLNRAMTRIAEQNKLSLTQFKVALQQEGHGYKQFRENLRDKLTIDTLQKNHRRGRQKISESAIDDLIKSESYSLNKNVQYNLLDILVPAPNGTPVVKFNQLLTKTQNLRKRILANQKSAAISIKKMQAAQENLGWVDAKSLSPAYLRTLSLMDAGEYSPIVRDAKGFHILQLIEQRGGDRKITQQAQVRHILISSDDPKAKTKVIQLRKKILAGGDFAALARENSADKGSAQQGGDLGLMDPASFVPPFAKSVVSLPLNTLSQPIQTRFGWHLIEVLERKVTDSTRQALKTQAESILNKKDQPSDTKNWLQGLKDQAYIEYRF